MDELSFDGPVVLAVLDGVGLARDGQGNAVAEARMPFLWNVVKNYPHIALEASGEEVGLLPGQMGNSEVGHNTMGAGRAFKQGIAKIEEAFNSGEIYNSEAWKGAITRVNTNQRTLHFAGIFSDGGVHSHISHLEQMIKKAYDEGVRIIRVHAIFDGRDVPPQSEPKFIRQFEAFAWQFTDADIKIASGGGRMTTVADRYENDWGVVKKGFDMMVYGRADYYFNSAEEGIKSLRNADPGLQDQYLPAFVVVDKEQNPIGKIEKGDALIYFDFRADRAIEIAQAFTYWDFPYFDRDDYSPVDVYFVGMTEYNSDTHVPEHRLVEPVKIDETLSQFLGQHNISQLAVSETVKFGHITYYFNGNSYNKAPGEDFKEIDSYTEPFETRPWMKTAEITDEVINSMQNYRFVRLNFPGGDMVGHTADFDATVIALEAIDLSLKRIAERVDELGGCLIIVADHGNAEELLDEHRAPKTAHTTNLVPCIFYDNTPNRDRYQLAEVQGPGLKNLTATLALFLGHDDYPESWCEPLISVI
ncbi:2,3-bisphosphoglycerate-independent phosphoglycerate mutase [Candidatus Saccharibacteria bacterium]|nr:2,3-bisphosphoglycerate-independent phosphoglycerate mutase [Candidatus Saccharibacteria bacterium]